jgi:hypothetical protein
MHQRRAEANRMHGGSQQILRSLPASPKPLSRFSRCHSSFPHYLLPCIFSSLTAGARRCHLQPHHYCQSNPGEVLANLDHSSGQVWPLSPMAGHPCAGKGTLVKVEIL